MLIQWNHSYPGGVGPRGARIFETAHNFESSCTNYRIVLKIGPYLQLHIATVDLGISKSDATTL